MHRTLFEYLNKGYVFLRGKIGNNYITVFFWHVLRLAFTFSRCQTAPKFKVLHWINITLLNHRIKKKITTQRNVQLHVNVCMSDWVPVGPQLYRDYCFNYLTLILSHEGLGNWQMSWRWLAWSFWLSLVMFYKQIHVPNCIMTRKQGP